MAATDLSEREGTRGNWLGELKRTDAGSPMWYPPKVPGGGGGSPPEARGRVADPKLPHSHRGHGGTHPTRGGDHS